MYRLGDVEEMSTGLQMPGAFPEVECISDRPSRVPTTGGGGASRKCRWCACAPLVNEGRTMLDRVSDRGEKGSVCSVLSVP